MTRNRGRFIAIALFLSAAPLATLVAAANQPPGRGLLDRAGARAPAARAALCARQAAARGAD